MTIPGSRWQHIRLILFPRWHLLLFCHMENGQNFYYGLLNSSSLKWSSHNGSLYSYYCFGDIQCDFWRYKNTQYLDRIQRRTMDVLFMKITLKSHRFRKLMILWKVNIWRIDIFLILKMIWNSAHGKQMW